MTFPTPQQAREFYGDPRGIEARLAHVVPLFKIYYQHVPVKWIRIHPLLASSLKIVLDNVEQCYNSQAEMDAAHVSNYSGSYEPRNIRGSSSISLHAYGAAVDFDAEHNGMTYDRNAGFFKSSHPLVQAFKAQGWFWGGDFKGRRDPMHFEAVRR